MRGEWVRGALCQPKGVGWEYQNGSAWVSGANLGMIRIYGAFVYRKKRAYRKP